MLFLDTTGRGTEEILQRIPPKRADDVIVLDFADAEHPPALNLFYDISRERHSTTAGALVEIARSIWDYGGSPTPRLDLYLRAAARVMLSILNPHRRNRL